MDEAEHNVKEGSSQSPSKESLNSSNNDSKPSAEDIDWVDSCLVKFTDPSESDWSPFKESWLEIFNVPGESDYVMAADFDNNDYMELGDNNTPSSGQTVEASMLMMTDDHSEFTDEGEGSNQEEESKDNYTDVSLGRLKKKWLNGKNLLEDALLPDHAEFAKAEDIDSEFFRGFLSFEPETSTDPIFNVWDLGFSDEQDEFTMALNSAFEELKSGVADGGQGSSAEPMDHVLAGISGLSLG